VNEDAYVTAVEDVRIVSRAQFERAVEAMGVLATMIADQANASMQNLAVLEQALEAKSATDRLTRELDTIIEASGAIAAAGDPLPTLERIADSIGRVIPSDSCIIYELEVDGSRLRPLTVSDPYADAMAEWRPAPGVGIPGVVAQSGSALRIDDVPSDPRFVPVPHVPVEPEAILAVPMLFNGEVTGVITVSRFQRRTFSDHELDVLRILAAQSAIALATATFRDAAIQRLEAERAQAELAHRINLGGPVGPMLDAVLTAAHRLLACSGAALRIDDPDLVRSVRPIGLSEQSVQRLARAHRDARERARTAGRPVQRTDDDAAVLISPVEVAGRPLGEFLLSRTKPFSESDLRLAAALARLAGSAAENARANRSTRRMRAGYALLAELGAKIAASQSSEEVLDLLVRRTHELSGGTATVVVRVSESAEEIDAFALAGRRTRHHRVLTAGQPRLRMPHVPDETGGSRGEVLDAWGLALSEALSSASGTHAHAAPLLAPGHRAIGALVVLGSTSFGEDERRLLEILGQNAAASLAARRAEEATDQALRARCEQLATLTEHAQRIAACQEPQSVLSATLSALRNLTDARGAAWISRDLDARPKVQAVVGIPRARAVRLIADLPDESWDAIDPVPMDLALAIPLPSGSTRRDLIVAAHPAVKADNSVLLPLARYGAIALESSERLGAERKSLAESRKLHHGSMTQASELERSLSIQRALSEAVLGRPGMMSVIETLVRFQGGRVTAYDAELNVIAGFPDPADDDPISELVAQEVRPSVSPPLAMELEEGRTLLAAPIQAEGERLGWLAQRLSRRVDDVDRAAITHAATAAALAMLRLRASEEADARMRGEFLQSLLAGETSAEYLVRHGRALTYDLSEPSRFVVAAAAHSPESAERLYREAVRWARREPKQIFVAKQGDELTALGPGHDGWPRRLHQALTRAVGPVLVGVGSVAEAPADYRRSFLDARQCVRTLRALDRDGVLSLDEDGLEQLLLRATDTDHLISFVRRLIGPLQEYDAAHRSSLVETLDLVFEHGWNLRAAARAVHVHVSTLRYRLSRVEAIAGIDLQRHEDRLALELALRSARLLSVSGS
jgi:GAF domain-containing protein